MVPKVDTHCELVKREGQENPKVSSTLGLKRVDSMEMPKSKVTNIKEQSFKATTCIE